ECWDRMHPIPDKEEGEGMEVRTSRFFWINDPDSGARFPNTVRSVPIVRVKEQPLSYQDVRDALANANAPQNDLDAAVLLADDLPGQLSISFEELGKLEQGLTARCGQDAPALTGLRQAMDECQNYLK